MYALNKIYLTIDDSTVKLTINNNILSSGYVHNHMYNKELFIVNEIHTMSDGDYKINRNIVTNNYDLVSKTLLKIKEENIFDLSFILDKITF